jgi:uncharacterized protein
MPNMQMDSKTPYKPARFFLIAFVITWTFLFAAAYLSGQGGTEGVLGILLILGMSGPFVAALVMFRQAKDPVLWNDYRDRLISLRRIDFKMLPFILFLMPAAILLSIGISVLFGQSPSQFAILLGPAFLTLPGLLGIFLAPAMEEAGWRGYGVDSLRSRFSLFLTSVLFGTLWACWHIPLVFIKGMYHSTLLSSWLFTANFFVSVFALAFINNWIFYRNNRSIIACFLFHLSANVFMSFIPAEQYAKCIVTVLLLLFAAGTVIVDRKMYFEDPAPAPVS